jgi:hypothetical protein
MPRIIFSATILMSATIVAAGSLARAAEPTGPTLVPAPVERVFVPLGFDDNDDIELIVHGNFPNTCYKVGPTTAVADAAAKTVTITAQAYKYPGAYCAQVIVPYIQPVKIGTLKPGEYRVIVADAPDTPTTTLTVAAATTSDADDFLYAPVEQAGLAADADGTMTLTLEGVYPYMFVGCMVMDEVRIDETPGHILVVRPIATTAGDDDEGCRNQAASKKFVVKQAVDFPLTAAEYLLHVRVLAGSSVNRLIEIER